MKFQALERLMSAGQLQESDLTGASVTPGDFMKMRQGGDGRAWSSGGGKDTPTPSGKRRYRYVFVQEVATGWAKDVPLATGWDITAFRDRNSPIIFSHGHSTNYGDFPVARGGPIVKNKLHKGVPSMLGHVDFPDEGKFDHVDLIHDMVADGLLNCGSVGFDIKRMREPTEAEVKTWGLGPYSAIFEKNELAEYSLCSVGQQSGAGVIYSDEGDGAFAQLIQRGEYSAESVQYIREVILQIPSDKTFHTLGDALAMDEFLGHGEPEDPGVTLVEMSEAVGTLGGDMRAFRESFTNLSERVVALETAPDPVVETTAVDELDAFIDALPLPIEEN